MTINCCCVGDTTKADVFVKEWMAAISTFGQAQGSYSEYPEATLWPLPSGDVSWSCQDCEAQDGCPEGG